MDGKERCFYNILIERFWCTIKYEEIHLNDYETVALITTSIMKYVKFYNFKNLIKR